MNRWIPISEKLPKPGEYILLSFENRPFPDIARYEINDDGGITFYPCEEGGSYLDYGFVANAWMPLPKPYREVGRPAWKNRVLDDFMKNSKGERL